MCVGRLLGEENSSGRWKAEVRGKSRRRKGVSWETGDGEGVIAVGGERPWILGGWEFRARVVFSPWRVSA